MVVRSNPLFYILKVAGTTVLGLSLFSFLCGLHPFALGLWFQSEPTVLAFYIAGGLAGLVLAAAAVCGMAVGNTLRHPAILALLALVAWSGLISLAQPLAMRSWLGTPETGQGVFSLIALAALTLLARWLWRFPRPRKILMVTALFAGTMLTVLDLALPRDHALRPDAWPEYGAFVGLFLLVALSCLPGHGRRFRTWTAVSAGLALAMILLSHNRSAWALAAYAPLFWLVVSGLGRRLPIRHTRRLAAVLVLLTPLMVGLAMAGLGVAGVNESAAGRLMMDRVALARLRAEPMTLLHGAGWGSFNDSMLAYLNVEGTRYYLGGIAVPGWEGTNAGAFHVHNEALEILLDTGLPGLMLAGLFVLMLAALAPRHRFAVTAALWAAVAGLAGAWFLLPACLPFAALAVGATTAQAMRRGLPRKIATALPLFAAAAMGLGAFFQYHSARNGENLAAAIAGPAPATLPGILFNDFGRGGPYLWWTTLSLGVDLSARAQAGQPLGQDKMRWLTYLLKAGDDKIARGQGSLRLTSLAPAIRGDLAVGRSGGEFAEVGGDQLPLWRRSLERLLLAAPLRSDLAIPFLEYCIQRGDRRAAAEFSQDILARQPFDPVGHWFLGLARIDAQPGFDEALRHLSLAIDQGIDRFLPVSDVLDLPGEGARRFILDADGLAVARVFSAALARSPDADGLRQWVSIYKRSVPEGVRQAIGRNDFEALSGRPLLGGHSSLADGLLGSDEFRQRFPALNGTIVGLAEDDRAFVTQILTNMAGGAADPARVDRWSARLRESRPAGWARILAEIAMTEDFRTPVGLVPVWCLIGDAPAQPIAWRRCPSGAQSPR